MGYIQLEHTSELTHDEAITSLEAAGFQVPEVYGRWLVVDPESLKINDFFHVNTEIRR